MGAELAPFLLSNFGMAITKQRKITILTEEKSITFFGMFVSCQESFIQIFTMKIEVIHVHKMML